jgi:histidinol-phosphate/aromatic aminotransferase/cobyric acid decarboxylase-like protein
MVVGPTFGEYARAAAAAGANVREVCAEPPDFFFPIPAIVRSIQIHRPRLLFLCNPNNPTGRVLDAADTSAIVDACGQDTLPVVDEAYRAFVGGVHFAPPPEGQCLVLRSMTKDFALAGLRLGYALGEPDVLHRLAGFQPAWSVNAVAQAAGTAALNDLTYYRKTLAHLRTLSSSFFGRLRHAGMPLVHSDTHFTLVHLDEPARLIRQRLLGRGIQVRDCASFGLPFHIRVATRLEEQNQRLIEALADCPPGSRTSRRRPPIGHRF